MFERSKVILIAALLACAGISYALSHITIADAQGEPITLIEAYSYYYDILLGIGISVILASSLNLVNGYTGQFSLGHAGFMAVGAYASSWLSLAYGHSLGTGATSTMTAFFLALVAGGIAAAIAGLEWIRYRVRFENGVELGTLDAKYLAPRRS